MRSFYKLYLAKQKIPTQAKSSTAKVRQICQEYPNEFLATLAGNLQCNLCNELVKCDKKFLWKATEKISNNKQNWRRRANPFFKKLM